MSDAPTIRTYRKRPVEIEAVQFTGTSDSCAEVLEFLGGSNSGNQRWNATTNTGGVIVTLEGEMAFGPGDWIIRGVANEFYPCRGDIFTQTYEPVDKPATVAVDHPAGETVGVLAERSGDYYAGDAQAVLDTVLTGEQPLGECRNDGCERPAKPGGVCSPCWIGEPVRAAQDAV